MLTIAPCIGTDQMGPKRFGAKGKLAFSFGNVAQDEGSAMAQWAWPRAGRRPALATNTLLVYFKDVVQAFEARFKQLGGKIVAQESYATGANNVSNAVSQLNSAKADVYVTSTVVRRAARVRRRACARSATTRRSSTRGPVTAPTGCRRPKVTNYYAVTYASAFGDDPNPAVNKLAKAAGKAGTGGFVTGAAAIDGVVDRDQPRRRLDNGAALAAQMVKFNKVPTISGLVSFSPSLHTVFGRKYRVIKIPGNKEKVVGSVTAKVVPKIYRASAWPELRSNRPLNDQSRARPGGNAAGRLRLALVRGRAGARRRHARAAPRTRSSA